GEDRTPRPRLRHVDEGTGRPRRGGGLGRGRGRLGGAGQTASRDTRRGPLARGPRRGDRVLRPRRNDGEGEPSSRAPRKENRLSVAGTRTCSDQWTNLTLEIPAARLAAAALQP